MDERELVLRELLHEVEEQEATIATSPTDSDYTKGWRVGKSGALGYVKVLLKQYLYEHSIYRDGNHVTG